VASLPIAPTPAVPGRSTSGPDAVARVRRGDWGGGAPRRVVLALSSYAVVLALVAVGGFLPPLRWRCGLDEAGGACSFFLCGGGG
jgi:hypothetical protein